MIKNISDLSGSAPSKSVRPLVGAFILACAAIPANASTLLSVQQAVNIFTGDVATGGAPTTVDVGGPIEIGGGVEFPGFAFGTYDIDVMSTSLTMTFVNDPNELGVAVYDSNTADAYYFEFAQQTASASISSITAGFGVTVEVIAPGSTASSTGSFVDGLPTSFEFGNGGILITVGDGTDLFAVGTGGSFTVDFAPVPLPASLPFLMSGLAGLGLMRRRTKNTD